jgi:hypothetical protein
MTARFVAFAASIVRLWTRAYTHGLPAEIGRDRLSEIESDLWEYQHDSNRAAKPGEMLTRLLRGMPQDLWWRLEQTATAGAPGIAPAPRMVRASAFTCSLAFHVVVVAGMLWWASWPAERTLPRVWPSQPRLTAERAVEVAAPLAASEFELPATVFPALGVSGVLVTPVSGLSQQPIHLPGTWVLDLTRTDPSDEWAATVPSGDPLPPPPPGASSLTISRTGTDLAIDQKWDAGSQRIMCELVDARRFADRSNEKMPPAPSTIAFWDGSQAVTRVLVSLRLKNATVPAELRMTYRADAMTLRMNSEVRLPQGVFSRRFVYSRQN